MDRRQHRQGQVGQIHHGCRRFLRLRALQSHERRAEPLQTGKVLVAGRLVDGPLAAQFGINGHDAHTIRLHPAIAAAFADVGVDEHAPVGVGELPTLAPTAFLGGAGLHIKNDRHALDLAELFLNFHQLVAGREIRPRRKARKVHRFLRVIHHRQPCDAHRMHLGGDAIGIKAAVIALPPGHRHGVVVQDLVGHRGARRHCRADRHQTRVVVGAVAEVLKHMRPCREWCLADPVRALAPHLGEPGGLAVHPLHHEMAPDARIGAAARRHLGRGVVRTARAEIRQPRCDILGIVRAARLRQPLNAGLDAIAPAPLVDQHLAQLFRHHHRIQRIACREHLMPPVVLRAEHAPPAAVVKDRLFRLHFDQLALFLDADDQIQPLGPVVEALEIHRPDLPHLVGGNAQSFRLGRINPQQCQRMHQVEPVLARRHQPDLRPRLAPDAPVHAVGVAERLGSEPLVVQHPGFLLETVIHQADVQAARRHREFRRHEPHPVRVAIDHRRRLDRVLHRLEADPDPCEPRQRPGIQPVIHHLLHTRRADHGHVGIDQRPVGLVQRGRRLAGMVIPHRHHHAAACRSAREIRVPHHVARPVHPRPLAVPQRKDALEFPLAAQFGLLRAPGRRRRKILVQSGLEPDIVLGQQLARARHLHVHRTQGRSAIAGDVTGGVPSRRPVPRLLHQHQPDQRLRSVQQNRRFRKVEAVVQRDNLTAHLHPPRAVTVHPMIGQSR